MSLNPKLNFKVHFEPEDVQADSLEQVESIINKRKQFISIRKIVPTDENGFPINPNT